MAHLLYRDALNIMSGAFTPFQCADRNNAGEEAVLKYVNRIPPYAETIAYVPRVLAYYKRYRTES